MSVRALLTIIIPLFIISTVLFAVILLHDRNQPGTPLRGVDPHAVEPPEPAVLGAGYEWAEYDEADLTTTESGLKYYDITVGNGPSPATTSTVAVNYIGKLSATGRVFDSSYDRGEPAMFRLDGVIEAWTEGVSTMQVGGKRVLVCPSHLAYGDTGQGDDIPPGAELIFEVELLNIL